LMEGRKRKGENRHKMDTAPLGKFSKPRGGGTFLPGPWRGKGEKRRGPGARFVPLRGKGGGKAILLPVGGPKKIFQINRTLFCPKVSRGGRAGQVNGNPGGFISDWGSGAAPGFPPDVGYISGRHLWGGGRILGQGGGGAFFNPWAGVPGLPRGAGGLPGKRGEGGQAFGFHTTKAGGGGTDEITTVACPPLWGAGEPKKNMLGPRGGGGAGGDKMDTPKHIKV